MDAVEKIYDEASYHWHNNPEFNQMFLTAQQTYFNHCLQTRGHVFLNEVFDALGFPRTTQGTTVGWMNQDIRIKFGVNDETDYSHPVVLKFNVEGVISHKIEEE